MGVYLNFFFGLMLNSDFLFGLDFWFLFVDRFVLIIGFFYVIFEDLVGINGVENEVWNIGINLMFILGGVGCY